MDNLSRIALFKALFADELDNLKDRSLSELSLIFHTKFPSEILSDPKTLEVINSMAVRIEHMKQQYLHVEKFAVKCLNELFSVDVPNTSNNKLAFRFLPYSYDY